MPRPRNPKSNFFYILESTQQPVYLLDQNQKILFANDSLAHCIGVAKEELEQVSCTGTGSASIDPIGALVRGLAILSENQGDTDFVQVVFLAPENRALERHLARVQKMDDGNGTSGWMVTILKSDDSEIAALTSKNLVAQLAQIIHESLPTKLPAFSIGTSLIAKKIKRQIEIATLGQTDFTISGPPGSDCEQLARFIFRQFPQPNRATLTPINCVLADQISIQESIRRLSRQQTTAVTGDYVRRVDWLLLIDIEQLESAAAMELDGFLELPKNRIGLIATSSIPSERFASECAFPNSLLARASALSIELPALIRRRDDLPLIFRYLLEEVAATNNRSLPNVPMVTIEAILEYTWPGNVVEMRESIERFFTLEKSELANVTFLPEDLPERIRFGIKHSRLGRAEVDSIDLEARLAAIEHEFIERALLRAKYNRSKAAKDLGISRAKLLRRCEQLSIKIPDGPIDFEVAEAPEFDEAD